MNRNFAGNSRKIIAFLWIFFSSFFVNHNFYLKYSIRWERFYCSCWESFLRVAVALVSMLRNKSRAFWIFVWSVFGGHIVWEKPLRKSSLCFVFLMSTNRISKLSDKTTTLFSLSFASALLKKLPSHARNIVFFFLWNFKWLNNLGKKSASLKSLSNWIIKSTDVI